MDDRNTILTDAPASARPPAAAPSTVVVDAAPDPDREQLRWGPIWAGLAAALGVFILLSMLAVAVGLEVAPVQPTAGVDPDIITLLVGSVIVLVAFFVGGFIAAWSAHVTDPARALLNGFLVWCLFLFVVAIIGALGVGTLVGAAANLFEAVRPEQLTGVGADIEGAVAEVEVAATDLQGAAWESLLALALSAAAAALGGVIGARDEVRNWRAVRA
jgi:ABC-type transport system involved in multi-copper enzyme maturation permease subunit